ncbi:putative HVA22-like protein g [Vicia villosa]|uniref:putative HVA22-like protein g n=1 Tax=Vicia villosa TaxID=3911 RepID=UPI00273B339A|nr:putative HVA22-like protein g [Vicia villosa]
MLGDFINRILILLLGYAYPGFECYKTVEKNRVDIEELRFWCKYWIIVALFTVLEKFLDIFIAWLPMYGEVKLIFFVYMWYPKTKGTSYVYETVLRPYVSKHENDIDRTLQEWKARGWDYVIFYWQYCAQFGHSAFVQFLQQLASHSSKLTPKSTIPKSDEQGQNVEQISTMQSSFMKQNSSLSKSKKWPTSPPSSPSIINRHISETTKSQTAHVNVDAQTEYVDEEGDEAWETESVSIDEAQDEPRASVSVKDRINRARARLRRLDTQNPRTPKTPQRRQL